jgi:hypothetical protein
VVLLEEAEAVNVVSDEHWVFHFQASMTPALLKTFDYNHFIIELIENVFDSCLANPDIFALKVFRFVHLSQWVDNIL